MWRELVGSGRAVGSRIGAIGGRAAGGVRPSLPAAPIDLALANLVVAHQCAQREKGLLERVRFVFAVVGIEISANATNVEVRGNRMSAHVTRLAELAAE